MKQPDAPRANVSYDGFCNLPWEVDSAMLKISSAEVQDLLETLPDSEFALICHGPTGTVHRLLPMATAALAKHSAGVVVGLHDAIPSDMAGAAAKLLVNRLSEMQVEAPRELKMVCSGTARRYWAWNSEWDADFNIARSLQKKSTKGKGPVEFFIKVSANPLLRDSQDVSVPVRKVSDLKDAHLWLDRNAHKLSSYARHTMAVGLIDGYLHFGIDPIRSRVGKTYHRSLMKHAHDLTSVRQDAAYMVDERREALDQVKLSADTVTNGDRLIAAYEGLLSTVEKRSAPWTIEEGISVAMQMSGLDEALGIQDKVTPAFSVFFPTAMEKQSAKPASPVVYSEGAIILRECDFDQLELMPLRHVKEIFSSDVVQGLRTDPIATFEKLSAAGKRWMANFMNERIRGGRLYPSPTARP